jgi:4-hydroxybenzoate polyprenyltransferase
LQAYGISDNCVTISALFPRKAPTFIFAARSMNRATLLSYLRLMRFPNVFTAMADIAMGFLFVRQSIDLWPVFVLLLVASSLMYLAGMVLNDVYDVEVDREERPSRPIPSGAVPLKRARTLGYLLLFAGISLGCAAGWLQQAMDDGQVIVWRAGAVSLLLAACIVGYDRILKKTWLGPCAMGSCRFFNVLLAMSVARELDGPAWTLYYTPAMLLVAGGIGVYILGVTIFARTEAKPSNRLMLIAGLSVMTTGVVMLGLLAWIDGRALPFRLPAAAEYWPLLLTLLGLGVARLAVMAIVDPRPARVQVTIKQSLMTLIMLDAGVCLLAANGNPFYALGVVALLAPMIWLGRWMYST